jgi:hypothetical protein
MRFTFPSLLLGELLVERGLILPLELEDALAEQRSTGRRLGEVLVSRGALTGAQLTRALAEQYGVAVSAEATVAAESPAEPYRPLGRMLVSRGVISQTQLDEALEAQRKSGRRLGDILVGDHGVSMLDLAAALGAQHGLEVAEGGTAVASRYADESVYEIKGPGRKPLFTTDSFLEATDFAFEYLAAEAPDVLEIVRVRGRERERVWECDRREPRPAPPHMIDRYGFDPTTWTGPRG